ncbi:MAG: hypothetical protein KJI69_05265 [Patescibacteria group bacterium]|nr:hypothetical protein [Patescibacteria group bacterium]
MLTIKDYEKLNKYMTAFGSKALNLMIIVSRGGLGKTFLAEEALIEEAPVVFTGHVTPLGMYKELLQRNKEEQDFIVIFDDVDTLMLNKTNVALLKQLCDTREEKTIRYSTTSPILRDMDSEFETKCKVLMLMNDVKTDDKNLNALLTRAHFINFDPPDTEIITHMKTFGKDKDILKYIETYAPFSKTLNLRVYKRAVELKEAGLDWKEEIVNELNIDTRLFEIERLLRKYDTDIEREEAFKDSRATYYRFKKLFLAKNPNYIRTINKDKKVETSAV